MKQNALELPILRKKLFVDCQTANTAQLFVAMKGNLPGQFSFWAVNFKNHPKSVILEQIPVAFKSELLTQFNANVSIIKI